MYEDASIVSKYLIKTNYIFKVMEFHPEDQTVDIIQDVLEYTNSPVGEFMINNEFGVDVAASLLEPDILAGVPVLQPRWGQFEIQCCPKKGDTGVLMVFTNDIRNWMKDGGPSIPNTDNHFMKSSCVFVPFIPNAKNCAQDYPTDNNSLVIKSNGVKIVLTDDGTNTNVSIEAKTMNLKADNGFSFDGDVSVTGKVTASDDVKIGSLSLKDHKHKFDGTNVTAVVTGEVSAIPGATTETSTPNS